MDENLMQAICDATEGVVVRIGPDHHQLPTPCSEWTVGDLANRLLGTLELGRALLSDEMPTVQAGPGQVPAADLIGDDLLGSYRAGAKALVAATTDAAVAGCMSRRSARCPVPAWPDSRPSTYWSTVGTWPRRSASRHRSILHWPSRCWRLPVKRSARDGHESTSHRSTGRDFGRRRSVIPTGGVPRPYAVTADDVLRALAEPQRIRILRLVGSGELAAGEIAEHFDITAQAVSQHLRVLKDADVLAERRDGARRLYSVRPEAIESVRDFLDELWPSALGRLKSTVEEGRSGKRRPKTA